MNLLHVLKASVYFVNFSGIMKILNLRLSTF